MPQPAHGTSGSAVIPALRYRDAHKAIAWLQAAFGFTVQALYDGPGNTVAHAQLVYAGGMIMIGSYDPESVHGKFLALPDECGGRSTITLCLIVKDAAALQATAEAAGARILSPLAEMEYGGKAFSCSDTEGYVWSIGEYDPWAG